MELKRTRKRKLKARFRKDATHLEKVLDKFDEEHPFPRWKCEVWLDQLLICKMDLKDRRFGWQVIYHITDCGTHDWRVLMPMGDKKLDKIVAEEGGSSLGTGCFGNEMPQHFRDQIQETKMEAITINGEEFEFDTLKTTNIMKVIVKCARQHRRVNITYRKGDNKIVRRDIAPYSMKDAYLYVTDTRDGNTKIKSLKIYSIVSAKKSLHKFKPQWNIEL
jgi:hypothetical protein